MSQRPALTTLLRRLQDRTDRYYAAGDRFRYEEYRALERKLGRYLDSAQAAAALARIGLTEHTLDRIAELRALDYDLLEIDAALAGGTFLNER